MERMREKEPAARTDEWLVGLHGKHVAFLRHQEGRLVALTSDGRGGSAGRAYLR